MPPSSPFRWTNRLFIQIGLATFCLLVGAAAWIVHTIQAGHQTNLDLQLGGIQRATLTTMRYWRNMHVEAAVNMANRPTIKDTVARLISSDPSPAALAKSPILKQLRNELRPFLQERGYMGFFIVPHNQINYGSMRDNNLGIKNLLLEKDPASLLQAFAGETVFSRPVRTDVPISNERGILRSDQYSMFVLTPVTDQRGKPFAILMFRIAPAKSLANILAVGRFGESGESYIVNHEGILLSPSRFDVQLMQAGLIVPDSSSTYQLQTIEPAGDITRGYRPDADHRGRPLTHIVQFMLQHGAHADLQPTRDYRGVEVINIGSWDEQTGLGLITQIDYQEAYHSYLVMRTAIIDITSLSILLLGIMIAALTRSRHNALRLVKVRTRQLHERNETLLKEIEDRKTIEQVLVHSQQATTAILRSAFDAIIATDGQGNIEMSNPAAEAMFGYTEDELLGKNIKTLMLDVISESHGHIIQQYHQHKAQTGEGNSTIINRRRELTARRKDGSLFPIELALEETHIDGTSHFTLTISDITERKAMIARLTESERGYRTIIENMSETFYRTDANGIITMASPAAEQLLGYRIEELLGMKIDNLYVSSHGREEFLRVLKERHGEVMDYETQLLRKDGLAIWVATNAHIHHDATGQAIGVEGTTRDITARKLAEEELRESRQRLAFHIQQTPLGVIEWDMDFKVIEWNHAAEEIFGYTRNDAIGRHANDLVIPPEYHDQIDDIWNALLGRLSGQRSTNPNITKSGRQIWCEWHNTPLVDEHMNVIGVASMVMDVTARKEAEEVLARDHQQLQALVEARTEEANIARLDAERANEAKSQFLANMSHELRTPIHTILSFAELGMKKAAKLDKEKIKQYFTNIHQGGERQLTLLNDLLDLSKLEAGTTFYDFNENDIREVIEGQLAQHELLLQKKRLRARFRPEADKTRLAFDLVRIEQVVRNLLSNAIKFSKEDGTITLGLKQTEIHTQHDTLPALMISVHDEGVGIPEAELEAIFDKFMQSSKTRSGAGGTGLGLAICREIISAHGGDIWAENNPEGGATFYFTLPILHK